MWVITYKDKPATVEQIYKANDAFDTPSYQNMDSMELASYVACDSKIKCRARYLSYVGFTWNERPLGIGEKEYK